MNAICGARRWNICADVATVAMRTTGWVVALLVMLGVPVITQTPATAQTGPPSLPSGLGTKKTEPSLPAGMGLSPVPTPQPEAADKPADPLRLSGFIDVRVGARMFDAPHQRRLSIAESRLHLGADKRLGGITLRAAGDGVVDPLENGADVDLENGRGFFDLREANAAFSPTEFSDVKAGRQILTWGTGDLLFINDLFPKDWNSFFLGRDEEYLKAPSDAAKLSLFSEQANLDVVYMPRFDADRFIDGRRVSYFEAGRGAVVGRNAITRVEGRERWFRDDEVALRLYRNLGAYEVALYGYDGFWKSPAGQNGSSGASTYPRLSVIGGSMRGPLGPGIAQAETGYYASRDDSGGNNGSVRNSEARLLVGYEQEAARNLTVGYQYYLEHMLDYGAYRRALSSDAPPRDEYRHLFTQRVTWLTLSQTLKWSLFLFFSPSDEDVYARPKVSYEMIDGLTLEAGGNLFFGRHEYSFFGQFENDSNLYAGLRYSF